MHEQPCRSPADCLYLFPPFYPTSFIRIVITTYNCTRSLNGSTTAIHSRYPFLYLPHVLSKQRYEPIQSSFQIEPQNPFHISRQPFFLVSSEAKGATSRDGACFLPVRNGRRFGSEGAGFSSILPFLSMVMKASSICCTRWLMKFSHRCDDDHIHHTCDIYSVQYR